MLKLTTATFSAVASVAACVFALDSVPLVGSAAKVATEFPPTRATAEKTQAFV